METNSTDVLDFAFTIYCLYLHLWYVMHRLLAGLAFVAPSRRSMMLGVPQVARLGPSVNVTNVESHLALLNSIMISPYI
jgi:hypothetical protein